MSKLQVTMIYEDDEVPSFPVTRIILEKTFDMNLPIIPAFILLKGDAIGSINFENPSYDPESDTYFIENVSNEGVERYYHGKAIDIMTPIVDRYIKHGWKVVSKKIPQ